MRGGLFLALRFQVSPMRKILANTIGLPCPYCGHPMQHPEEGRRYPTRRLEVVGRDRNRDQVRYICRDAAVAAAKRAIDNALDPKRRKPIPPA
jgi:hypothetical protein